MNPGCRLSCKLTIVMFTCNPIWEAEAGVPWIQDLSGPPSETSMITQKSCITERWQVQMQCVKHTSFLKMHIASVCKQCSMRWRREVMVMYHQRENIDTYRTFPLELFFSCYFEQESTKVSDLNRFCILVGGDCQE